MSNDRLQDLLNLAIVPRWSIVPHRRSQSVAEHSFRVAAIALEITRGINRGMFHPSAVLLEHRVLLWALVHDGPEAETGDIPSTIKKQLPEGIISSMERNLCSWYDAEFKWVPAQERSIVKIADKVEELLFMTEWGVSIAAAPVILRTRGEIDQCINEATAKWGWIDLPKIVDRILGEGEGYSNEQAQAAR